MRTSSRASPVVPDQARWKKASNGSPPPFVSSFNLSKGQSSTFTFSSPARRDVRSELLRHNARTSAPRFVNSLTRAVPTAPVQPVTTARRIFSFSITNSPPFSFYTPVPLVRPPILKNFLLLRVEIFSRSVAAIGKNFYFLPIFHIP